jgi:hypothetical protein
VILSHGQKSDALATKASALAIGTGWPALDQFQLEPPKAGPKCFTWRPPAARFSTLGLALTLRNLRDARMLVPWRMVADLEVEDRAGIGLVSLPSAVLRLLA